jgi:hypothetical protein
MHYTYQCRSYHGTGREQSSLLGEALRTPNGPRIVHVCSGFRAVTSWYIETS